MPRLLPLLLLVAATALGPRVADADELTDAQRLQATGDLAGALTRVEQGLAARPRDADLRFARGVLLAELKRNDEALEAFTRLSEDYPELADPLNNIAVLQAASGRTDAARAALEAALRADPQHRAARENLADVYVRLAVRLWDGLLDPSQRPDDAIARKLRMARELLRAP
jgi:Flp pilus assembly protein TadD